MLSRLGFVGRLSAIILLALLALWAVGAALSYVTHAPLVATPSAFPLPNQMAAIVELLETTDGARRKIVLDAVKSDTLGVEIVDRPPAVSADQRRLKGIEWLIERYVNELGNHEVIAVSDPAIAGTVADARPGSGWMSSRRNIRIAVALKSGGYAIFEPRGEITRRFFGVPAGYWVAVLGSLVGIAALFAVWREARPLKELSRAVTRFSGHGTPVLVTPRGAPELKRLIEATNRMQERIATLLQGRTVLLGAVSHDLKTYITRLKLRTEMISDPDQEARANRDLDDMTVLIDDALAMARGGSEKVRTSVVDLGALLAMLSNDHPNVELALPDTPLRLMGDEVALRRLFTNLVDNALRYGAKAPKLTAGAIGGRVRILIDDDGPGIPIAERDLVFEPFYRRDPSRSRETGGSGLGLAIAKQIADLHSGSITLGDSPQGGLRVIVELPMRAERASTPPQRRSA
ncbi:MAG: two-component sensor histidine kinase [Proteobacteria bacterium]|nr:two-component sensor histidine kinase [Pseudomonadota bacterium]